MNLFLQGKHDGEGTVEIILPVMRINLEASSKCDDSEVFVLFVPEINKCIKYVRIFKVCMED